MKAILLHLFALKPFYLDESLVGAQKATFTALSI